MSRHLARVTDAWSAVRSRGLYFSAVFLVIVVIGQLMMDGEVARFIQIQFPMSSRIESYVRLRTPSIDNLLTGLVLLAVGGLGFALTLPASRFYDAMPKGTLGTLRLSFGSPGWWSLALACVSVGLFMYLILRLGDGDYHWTFPLCLGLAILSAAAFWLWQDRKTGVKLGISPTWWEGAGLAALTLMAYFVLTYQLSEVPDSMLGDEPGLFEAANLIAYHDVKPNIFNPGIYTWPIAGSVFQAVFLKVFGATIWSWRLSAVVPELAIIVPLYLLVREAFDRGIAFMSVFLLVFSPLILAYSRLGWPTSQTFFPVVASLLCLYLGLERGSKLYLFLAGVMAGLSFYTYPAAKVATPMAVGYFLYLVLSRQLRIPDATSSILVFATGLTLLAAPSIIAADANMPEANYQKLAEGSFIHEAIRRDVFPDVEVDRVVKVSDQDLVLDPDYTARLLARGLVQTLHALQDGQRNQQTYIQSSLVGPVASVFFVVGLWACVVGIRRRGFALVLIWLSSCIFGLGMLTSSPGQSARIIPIAPVLPIMVAIGLSAVALKVRRLLDLIPAVQVRRLFDLFPAVRPLAVTATVLTIAVVNGYQFFHFASVDAKPNLQVAMLWELDRHPDVDQVMLVDSDPVYGYVSDGEILNGFQVMDTGATFERMTTQDLFNKWRPESSQSALLFFTPAKDSQQVGRYLRSTLQKTPSSRSIDIIDQTTVVSYYVVPGVASSEPARR